MQATGARGDKRRGPQLVRLCAVAGAVAVFVAACSGATADLRSAGDASPAASGAPTAAPAPVAAAPAEEAAPSPSGTAARAAKPATTAAPKARPAGTAAPRPSATRSTRPAPKPTKPAAKPTTRPAAKRTTKPAPKPPATGGMSSREAEVLRLANAERAKAGCGALRSHPVLLAVARAHSRDMGTRGYFAHESQDGRSPFDRMRAAGYRGGLMGENIAAGQPTAAAVMKAWMNSPGHRANILNCGYRVIGIGAVTVAGSPMRIYWTQNFGDR